MLTNVANNVCKTAGLLGGIGRGVTWLGWNTAKWPLKGVGWVGKQVGMGALKGGARATEWVADRAMKKPEDTLWRGLTAVALAGKADNALKQLKQLHNINYRYF